MSHRVLDAALIARAGEMAAAGLPEEIGAALGIDDCTLYAMLTAARDGTSSPMEAQLLEILAAGVWLEEST